MSDGGLFDEPLRAIAHAEQLASDQVGIFDIGAESTRPRAEIISPDTEWQRLAPILEKLRHFCTPNSPVRISVDTRHPSTAQKCIEHGIHWLNDVTGLSQPAMIEIARNSSVDWVVMHSLGAPADATLVMDEKADPVPLILKWGHEKIAELVALGIARERIILDPGIGFGKTPQQSWAIIREIGALQAWGVRIMVGHSRKSFLAKMDTKKYGMPSSDAAPKFYQLHPRDPQTATISTHLASHGVDYLRVHHVGLNEAALQAWTQIDGITQCQLVTLK